jgi:hypothetical protein
MCFTPVPACHPRSGRHGAVYRAGRVAHPEAAVGAPGGAPVPPWVVLPAPMPPFVDDARGGIGLPRFPAIVWGQERRCAAWVEFVQGARRYDWPAATALRGPTGGGVGGPRLEISGLEEVLDQAQNPGIGAASAEDDAEELGGDGIDAARESALDAPAGPMPRGFDRVEGGLAPSLGTETRGVGAAWRLVVGLSECAPDFWEPFVRPGGQA